MRLARLSGGLALVLVFLLVLVAQAPARLLGRVLPPEQVLMAGFQGTLWRGSASRCVLRLPPGDLALGRVSWSLEPLSLLFLAPRVTLDSHWGQQRFSGQLRLRGERDLDLREVELQASAELVQRFAPLAVDGGVSMQLQHLSLRDGLPYSAEGRLVWQDGGFASPRGRVPLGTYALEFTQQPGEPLLGEIVTVAGSLQAQGSAQLHGRRYKIDLALHGEEPLDAMLRNALDLMAAPENGGYRIRLDSEF